MVQEQKKRRTVVSKPEPLSIATKELVAPQKSVGAVGVTSRQFRSSARLQRRVAKQGFSSSRKGHQDQLTPELRGELEAKGAEGRPLTLGARRIFERHLNVPLGEVRVVVDVGLCWKFNAQAFTYGSQIFVRSDDIEADNINTWTHELWHVHQQRTGQVGGDTGRIDSDRWAEQEAQKIAKIHAGAIYKALKVEGLELLARGAGGSVSLAGSRVQRLAAGLPPRTTSVAPPASAQEQWMKDLWHSVRDAPENAGQVWQELMDFLWEHKVELGVTMLACSYLFSNPAWLVAWCGGALEAKIITTGVLEALGASGVIDAGTRAVQHGNQWWALVSEAHGSPEKVKKASYHFLKFIMGTCESLVFTKATKAGVESVKNSGGIEPVIKYTAPKDNDLVKRFQNIIPKNGVRYLKIDAQHEIAYLQQESFLPGTNEKIMDVTLSEAIGPELQQHMRTLAKAVFWQGDALKVRISSMRDGIKRFFQVTEEGLSEVTEEIFLTKAPPVDLALLKSAGRTVEPAWLPLSLQNQIRIWGKGILGSLKELPNLLDQAMRSGEIERFSFITQKGALKNCAVKVEKTDHGAKILFEGLDLTTFQFDIKSLRGQFFSWCRRNKILVLDIEYYVDIEQNKKSSTFKPEYHDGRKRGLLGKFGDDPVVKKDEPTMEDLVEEVDENQKKGRSGKKKDDSGYDDDWEDLENIMNSLDRNGEFTLKTKNDVKQKTYKFKIKMYEIDTGKRLLKIESDVEINNDEFFSYIMHLGKAATASKNAHYIEVYTPRGVFGLNVLSGEKYYRSMINLYSLEILGAGMMDRKIAEVVMKAFKSFDRIQFELKCLYEYDKYMSYLIDVDFSAAKSGGFALKIKNSVIKGKEDMGLKYCLIDAIKAAADKIGAAAIDMNNGLGIYKKSPDGQWIQEK